MVRRAHHARVLQHDVRAIPAHLEPVEEEQLERFERDSGGLRLDCKYGCLLAHESNGLGPDRQLFSLRRANCFFIASIWLR